MLTFEPGNDIALVVPFLVEGEPFVPDANSVTFTLRANNGAIMPIHDEEPVATGANDTQATINIDAAAIELANGVRFEQRTIIVRAKVGGKPWQHRLSFRVAPFLNTTVTEDSVRGYIGVGVDELPDSDLDIFTAYMQVETAASKATLDAALQSAGMNQLHANRAILARAVLAALPALNQRMLKRKSDGMMTAERDKIDLKDVQARARADLNDAMNNFTGRTTAAVPMLVFTNDTDVITGA